tara:strand:- start:43 stop:1062 length:1020 start_codon:yes stop_codon:yes gene_type:complete
MSKVRAYCGTLNNYSEDDYTQLHDNLMALLAASRLVYAIIAREIGESLTPHLQCYFHFKSQVTLKRLKELLGSPRWHLEGRRGTIQQAVDYCKKEGSYEEIGIMPQPGKRTDLDDVASLVKAGVSLCEIAEENPATFVKYTKGLQVLSAMFVPSRNFKTEVIWLHGPTGTGKSAVVYNHVPPEKLYSKMATNHWWDGYSPLNHTDVIVDDYRLDFAKFAELLRLFDRYPMQVECKGATVQFRPKRIWITAPKSPEEMWEQRTPEDLQQLMRRITHVIPFPLSETSVGTLMNVLNVESLKQFISVEDIGIAANATGDNLQSRTTETAALAACFRIPPSNH